MRLKRHRTGAVLGKHMKRLICRVKVGAQVRRKHMRMGFMPGKFAGKSGSCDEAFRGRSRGRSRGNPQR